MSLVTDHLQHREKAFEVLPHTPAMTSLDEARAIGIAPVDVIKTLVLDTAAGHALAVLPAMDRLDLKLAQRAVHDPHAKLASELELRQDFPDFELGAVPPLGSLLGVPTFVDPEVMDHETVVFAAGTQTESVKMRTDVLFGDEPVTFAALSRQPDHDDY